MVTWLLDRVIYLTCDVHGQVRARVRVGVINAHGRFEL
jgi:hypothetical protein